jgi:hypothetical protein
MKFLFLMLPTVPRTLEDRKRLRPIGRNNERYQQRLDEPRKLVVFADEVGAPALHRSRRGPSASNPRRCGPGAAGMGSDPRGRGGGDARPADQGTLLCRLCPLPGRLLAALRRGRNSMQPR